MLVLGAGCAGRPAAPVVLLDPVRATPEQQARIDGIRADLAPVVAAAARRSPESLLLLELDALYAPLDADERAFLEALRTRPGADPSVGIPADVEWVRVEGQVARPDASGAPTGPDADDRAGEPRPIPLQLVTAPVRDAFAALDRAMRLELGRGLLIGSAYRSPAYQLYLIVELLPRFGYSLDETLVHVSLPGASDHNRTDRLGVDFVNEAGIDLAWADAAAFTALPEYAWLVAHAAAFGFAPDPPRPGEPVASPWHWRFVGAEAGAPPTP